MTTSQLESNPNPNPNTSPFEELLEIRDDCLWFNPDPAVAHTHMLCSRYADAGECLASDQKDSQPLLQYLFEEDVRLEVVEALVAAGADVNACASTDAPKSSYGSVYSPLCLAVIGRRPWLVTKLLALGAKNEQVDEIDPPPMARAAASGYMDCVRAFIDFGLPPDDGQQAALWAAAGHGHADIVRYLLEQGADPNRRNHGFQMIGCTALRAVAHRDEEASGGDEASVAVARHLLVAGADPSTKMFSDVAVLNVTRSVGVLRQLFAAGAEFALTQLQPRYMPWSAARALLMSAVERIDSEAMLRKYAALDVVFDEAQDWSELLARETQRLREAEEEYAAQRAEWFWHYQGGRQRALELCIGTAALVSQWNSLVLVTIVEAELDFAVDAQKIPFRLKWNLVVETTNRIKKLL